MSAGDQKFVTDQAMINGKNNDDENLARYMHMMKDKKKSKPKYNYHGLLPNIVFNYIKHKTGDQFEKFLEDVFQKHVKIENSVIFFKHKKLPHDGQANSMFYADRYDYLRIAKAVMDHWNNDTCVGKYLKTVYDRRINKNKKSYDGDRSGQFDVAMYTKKYGGQFHFDIIGLSKRKILGMSGFGGQNIIIDFEKERIIVVNARDRHYNWKKIVLKKLKQK